MLQILFYSTEYLHTNGNKDYIMLSQAEFLMDVIYFHLVENQNGFLFNFQLT